VSSFFENLVKKLKSVLPPSRDALLVSAAWHLSALFLFLALWYFTELPEVGLIFIFTSALVQTLAYRILMERKLRSERSELQDEVKREVAGVREDLTAQLESSAKGVREDLTAQLESSAKGLKTSSRTVLEEAHTASSAISFLNQIIQPVEPIWFTRGFAASPELLVNIYKLIVNRKPKLVLDLGSGLTTLVAAYALRQNGFGRVVAWEHLREYSLETISLINQHGLSDWASVQEAPLEPTLLDGQEFSWYSQRPTNDQQIDLLLVDGPPESTGPLARYPAIPVLSPWFSGEIAIVLDDAERSDEQKALELWAKVLPSMTTIMGGGNSKRKFAILSLKISR